MKRHPIPQSLKRPWLKNQGRLVSLVVKLVNGPLSIYPSAYEFNGFSLEILSHEELHHIAGLFPGKLSLIRELHAVRCLWRIGLPPRQVLSRRILAVRISGTNEVRPVIAHLAGQIVMFADERPPAFGKGLEEKPEIHRVERSRVIPAWDFRIEIVIVQAGDWRRYPHWPVAAIRIAYSMPLTEAFFKTSSKLPD